MEMNIYDAQHPVSKEKGFGVKVEPFLYHFF